MGGKRKQGSGPSRASRETARKEDDGKLIIHSYEDVADSEDEFHIQRDKVLLEEGPAQKRQRRLQEEERNLEASDEEILDAPSDESDDDDLNDEAGEVLDASHTPHHHSSSESSRSPSPDLDAEGWGVSKQDYYNADPIETEADALEEEKEARRLQQKQLQQMTEADYGFDEIDWTTAGKEDDNGDTQSNTISQKLPMLEIGEDTSVDERMKILRINYPEFEPLAKEFLSLRQQHQELEANVNQGISEHLRQVLSMKHRALSGYLSALCLYFAIFTSGSTVGRQEAAPLPPSALRDHPVMDTLVKCRIQWESVKNVVVPDEPNVDSDEPGVMPLASIDVPNGISTRLVSSAKESKPAKANQLQNEEVESAKRRQKRLAALDEDLASLSALARPSTTTSSRKHIQKNNDDSDSSDFGDPTHLTTREAAAKASRKKSLKFYTAQIAGKASRRDLATRNAGGDEDLPYRERLRDRQDRLTNSAQTKAQARGADLGEEGGSSEDDEATANANREGSGEESDAEGYYDLISRQSASKKAAKATAAAAAAASTNNVHPTRITDPTSDGGKRGITYAIEKNKGLAPKRKKEVRNPRVKKRRKYEEKMKRLKSIRPVYKPEREGKGGYGGEMTGIKKGVVRSVRLG